MLASGLLDRLRQDTDLGPILFVGRRDMQGQEVSKGIDCQVELRSFLPLVPVVAGARPALGGALQGLTVEDGCRGLGVASLGQSQQEAQVLDNGREAAGLEPGLGRLVDRLPAGEVVGQHPPRRPGADEPAQGIEDLVQVVVPLRGVGGHQGEIGGHEGPFVVRDVARAGGTWILGGSIVGV